MRICPNYLPKIPYQNLKICQSSQKKRYNSACQEYKRHGNFSVPWIFCIA
jgi:hypothetical protein